MARPIEYDKNKVMQRAMEAFWTKGYEATSMKDLVAATGLTTRSMYNLFESKNGLFHASLEWYYEANVKKALLALKEGKGLEAIRSFMSKVIQGFGNSKGCLFTNTQCDRQIMDPYSLAIVDKYFIELETLFEEQLIYAKAHEGFKENPSLRAKQLIILIQGMSIYSKRVASAEESQEVLDDLLRLVNL